MSTTLAIILIGALAVLFVLPYVGYGTLLSRFRPRGPAAGDVPPFDPDAIADLPRISILIPAHNEAAHLRGKLNNTFNLLYPEGRMEVIVCSDGSTDGTDDIARGFADRGAILVRNEERSGKAAALRRLVDAATGDIVVFTDASANLRPDCVARLLHALRDPKVGVACARYVVGAEDADPESGYWGVEARLRHKEAERDMLLGASGACYAIRKDLVVVPPPDTVNDDYVIPLVARSRGFRVAYVHEAIAGDQPTGSSETLYYRWVRIAYGNYQMLWRHRRCMSPRDVRMAVPLVRKSLRTMGPLFLLAACFIVLLTAVWNPSFSPVLYLCVAGVAMGAVSVALQRTSVGATLPLRVVRFGFLAQLAYLHGAMRFITQRRKGLWRRPEETPMDLSTPADLPLSVRALKRTLDIIGATVGLIIFSPVMLLVAIAVKLDSRGPVFYLQEREKPGPDREPSTFRMFKFRSMCQDAEAKTGPVWASKGGEARVTRVGKVIRRYRIDELPQFINVLIGEMSIVGPRPERPFFTRQLEEKIPGYGDRISVVRPGITGWAQVNLDPDTSLDSVKHKVMHDLAYVAHLYRLGSYIKMEFRILFLTVWVMLRGKG